jgi:hypothetical protein
MVDGLEQPLLLAASAFSLTQASAAAAMLAGLLLIAYALKRRGLLRSKGAGPAAASTSVPTEVGSLQADMNELAERLASELDRKADRLERLLALAEARCIELQRLEAARPEPRSIEPRARPSADTQHREVYELADMGLSHVEIAQRLERPTGQVELILNLRRGTVAL